MFKVSVPPELVKAQNEAIHNLDFETAYNISRQILEYRRKSCEELQNSIVTMMDDENAQYSKHYDLKCESIALKQERESRLLKEEFRRTAKIYAEKHRNEVKALEKKWRALYNQAMEEAESKTQTAKISARILAQCDMYQSAISVRDSIKNDMKCARECLDGFQRQYKLMTERHEHEFDQLHLLIKNYMNILKKQGKAMRIAANTEKVAEESEISANAINSVLTMTTDESIRKSTIERFSPRISTKSKKRKIPRRPNSTINATQFSDI